MAFCDSYGSCVSKMEALANLAKELLAGVDGEKHLDIGHIQRYGYGWNNLYFDLGDYLETLYPQRVGEIEAALNACIVYKAHTPGYYSAGNGSYSAIDFYMWSDCLYTAGGLSLYE